MPDMGWQEFLAALAAVGALGTAAAGVVEALAKTLTVRRKDKRNVGLPYCGFAHILELIEPLKGALTVAYGPQYCRILEQQYRNGRGKGPAPNTIMQGVRLALPYMPTDEAEAMVSAFWSLPAEKSRLLVFALSRSARDARPPHHHHHHHMDDEEAEAATLAGRFALALDSRVDAAFAIAEQRYVSVMKLAAGATAVLLAVAFYFGMKEADQDFPLIVAILIGIAAVPLAPVAKDLTAALSDAAKSWANITGKSKKA